MKNISLLELMDTLPQVGKVEWIGIRPGKRQPLVDLTQVQAIAGIGLKGDHYASTGGKRQVTLIQAEHLEVVASFMNMQQLRAEMVRRNIVVRGINLLALKNKQFYLGEVLMEYTGLCHPCSYMEEVLGLGGYNAMRGHGGINARILHSGVIGVGDSVNIT